MEEVVRAFNWVIDQGMQKQQNDTFETRLFRCLNADKKKHYKKNLMLP
jgi:hypothetical protein